MMVDYNKLREKFPSKKNDRRERAARINAIAREYEMKKAELGARAPTMRRGFPYYMVILIGLMLVGALVIPQLLTRSPGAVTKAQKRLENATNALHNLSVALGRYRYHTGTYPTTEQGLAQLALKKLSRKATVDGWNGPYITALKPDPWQHDYVYSYTPRTGEVRLFSMGPDGRPGTDDDLVADPASLDEPFRDTTWTKGWMPQHLRGYVVAQNAGHKEQLEAQVDAVLHPDTLFLGETVLTEGWSFAPVWTAAARPADLPADPGPSAPSLVWRPVRVPHDWSVEDGTPVDGASARPRQGLGYYRRTLIVSDKAKGKYVGLRFAAGASADTVFLNGKLVGCPGDGGRGGELELTHQVKYGEPNELVIRVATPAAAGCAEPGAGLLHAVTAVIAEPAGRLIDGSLHLTTVAVKPEVAQLQAVYRTAEGPVTNTFEVARPVLWTPDRPFLYRRAIGGRTVAYGVRTVTADAAGALLLNGEPLAVKGVTLRDEPGLLGVGYDREVARRLLTALKDLGANAVCARRPLDPDFLALCDEMGFLAWGVEAPLAAAAGVVCPWPAAAVAEADLLDAAGHPTDAFYRLRAQWNGRDKTVRLTPHWTWPERTGEVIDVQCWTSGSAAELLLNGESLGRRERGPDGPAGVAPLTWQVPYAAGRLQVKVEQAGAWYADEVIETAERPQAVRLTAEGTHLAVGELGFVTIALEDENQVAVPEAQAAVTLTVEGPGELVAVGTAERWATVPNGREVTWPLAHGTAVAVVRRTAGTGLPVTLKATVEGLQPAAAAFRMRGEM